MIRRRLYIEERVSRLAVWSLRTAIFALPVTLIGLVLYATEALDFRSALYTVIAGIAVAALALLLAMAGFVVIWNEGLRGLGRILGAAALALMLITPMAAVAAFSVGLPVLYDITTDTEDPPAFVTLAMARSRSANPLAYPGDVVAEEQREAYPQIKQIEFDDPPDDIYAALMKLVIRHKWLVIDAVPPRGGVRDGRIEAVARSLPFGLRDDIVIRIRPIADGARVDMRSVSRNSDRDFGSNARRIDTLLSELSEMQGRRRR
ncbi:DUF1499 domain-containing protein [Ancylobacter pratisalsi]|uniref:DUF1499 domain-containing protein n=1 Tax=Ancylobacter pratisalsi TaxID=1745854 RepID=A0A6P1YPV5_9HYPH|nr:DUF1499 domain-containing protein [Ancylobacter pratisalsi]QIB33754.1 DUF1499 domain-containing protein [Ancylobacter pratisalsi]